MSPYTHPNPFFTVFDLPGRRRGGHTQLFVSAPGPFSNVLIRPQIKRFSGLPDYMYMYEYEYVYVYMHMYMYM